MSSYETFNWRIRDKLCTYIEKNWTLVGGLSGCLRKYKTGKIYIEKKEMRRDKVWGGSVEMCALALYSGYNVVTYYKGGYYKFGTNKSDQCFFFYNSGSHYDVILEP